MAKHKNKGKSRQDNHPPEGVEGSREAKKLCNVPTPEKIRENRAEMNELADIAANNNQQKNIKIKKARKKQKQKHMWTTK